MNICSFRFLCVYRYEILDGCTTVTVPGLNVQQVENLQFCFIYPYCCADAVLEARLSTSVEFVELFIKLSVIIKVLLIHT